MEQQSAADSLKSKDKYVYFLYSEQQKKHRTELEKKRSRVFMAGKVVVNGIRKPFTEMSTKDTNIYPDVKIVAEGWRSKMVYTDIYAGPAI